MVELSDLVKWHAQDFEELLDRFGVKNISVSTFIEHRKASEIEEKLVLAHMGLDECPVSMFLSSKNPSSYRGLPIASLLIPFTVDGALMVDEHDAAVDFFYLLEDNVIRPIRPSRPIALDGINLSYEGTLNGYRGPNRLVLNEPKLVSLTDDKVACKEILARAGVLVPQGIAFSAKSAKGFETTMACLMNQYRGSGIVVKPNGGSCGNGVRLFSLEEFWQAVDHAKDLFKIDKEVMVERRVDPVQWKDHAGNELDWNIRALVTFTDDPKWIDGEVRFAQRSGGPVNIGKGADATEVEWVCNKTGYSMSSIMTVATRATKALYDNLSKSGPINHGFLGLDIIASESGPVVIELNSGAVGGFGTIAKLRQRVMDSVCEVLTPSLGGFLMNNHGQRQSNPNYVNRENLQYSERDLIRFLYDYDHLKEAISHAKRVIALEPSAEMCSIMGSCYDELGMFSKAIKSIKEAIALDPYSDSAYHNLAVSYSKAGYLNKAVAAVDKALDLNPARPSSWSLSGKLALEKGLPVKAKIDLEMALKIAPDDLSAMYNLGVFHHLQGEYQVAASFFSEVLAVDPEFGDAKKSLAVSIMSLGRIPEGIEMLSGYLDSNPNDAVAHLNMGMILFKVSRSEESMKQVLFHLNRSTELDPKRVESYQFMGSIYSGAKEFEKAARWYAQACSIRPSDLKSRHLLAKSYQNAGHPKKAMQEYERILKRNPRDISAHDSLIKCYQDLNYTKKYWRALEGKVKAMGLDKAKVTVTHFMIGP